MSSAEFANLVLALVAAVSVLSALGRARLRALGYQSAAKPARPHAAGHHLQAAEGARRRARAEPSQLLPARLSRAIQLLFCVADNDDPAIEVVRKLMTDFPGHDTQLVIGCPAFGLNPKVESLAAMEPHRKHDVILISDSNVRVRPSYLRETACYLADPGVGLVTNLFAGVGEVHPGRGHGKPALNGFIAGGVAAAAFCGRPAWSASRCSCP